MFGVKVLCMSVLVVYLKEKSGASVHSFSIEIDEIEYEFLPQQLSEVPQMLDAA